MKEIQTSSWALTFTNEEARELFGEPRERVPGEYMEIPDEGPMGWGPNVPLDRDVSHIFAVEMDTCAQSLPHFKNGVKIERLALSCIDKAWGDDYFDFVVISPEGERLH